jgi:transcriptional regulator with XRE-family HTH domain
MERNFQLDWAEIVEEARRRRKEQGLSQQKLAVLAKVTQPTVSRFELNRQDLQLSSALAIMNALGMTARKIEGSLLFKRLAESPDISSYEVMFAPYSGAGGALQSYPIQNMRDLKTFLLRLNIEPHTQQNVLASLFQRASATIPNVSLSRMEIRRFWPQQEEMSKSI